MTLLQGCIKRSVQEVILQEQEMLLQEQLEKLKGLLDLGLLTQEEFDKKAAELKKVYEGTYQTWSDLITE